MKKIYFLLPIYFIVGLFNVTLSQGAGSRTFIRNQITKWGECKNVALTMTGGDIALYGSNGYACDGIPYDMKIALQELNADNQLIDDVVLTESGSWLILYGNNGIKSNGAPQEMFSILKRWNENEEIITSVTFNDVGDWIAITNHKYSASSDYIIDLIHEGEDSFGEFWAAHLTDEGMVLCFEKGYKFTGSVPENLKTKLRETDINVFRIKFLSNGSYFFADKDGHYSYYM